MSRRKQLEPDPRPPSVFDNADFPHPKTVLIEDGYRVAVIEPDDARALLARMISGHTVSDDPEKFTAVVARIGEMPPDVGELIAEWMVTQVGADFLERFHREQSTPKIDPPSREQLAQEKAESITTAFHLASGQFKKKNGAPRKTLVARRMFENGFAIGDIADVSGYSRGSLQDARQFVRAHFIREGKPLPPNLMIDPKYHGRRTGGDDQRGGGGKLFEENREASRLVASVADVLAPALPKMKRKAYSNAVEGIASAPISGTWDFGDDEDGEE